MDTKNMTPEEQKRMSAQVQTGNYSQIAGQPKVKKGKGKGKGGFRF